MADDEAAGSLQRKSETKLEEMEEDDEDEDFFEVERILAKSKFKGVVSYKVRWKGYGSEEDTWEPIDNLDSCKELIDEFDKQREESIRQKAEERKMRQAVMEGRVSSQESSEEDSLYPPNFKNSFWKDLEAGRIDVFDSNMYSKVKERTVKQLSLKEYQEMENIAEKKPVRDTVSENVNTPVKNNKSPKSISQKGKCPTSSSSKKRSARSSSSRKTKKASKNRSADISIQSDCDSDSDYKCTPVYTDSKDNEHSPMDTDKAVVERPGIKLIMKLPKPPGEKAVITDKHGQTSSKAGPHLKGDNESVLKQESYETTRKKKKKHHKHKHEASKHSHTESKHSEHKDKPKHADNERTASASLHTEEINHKQTETTVKRRDENIKNTDIEKQLNDISVKLKEKGHKPKEDGPTSVNFRSIKDSNRKRKISEPMELVSDSRVVVDSVKCKLDAEETADSEKITDFKVGNGCDLDENQKLVCKPEEKHVKTEVFDAQFSINCSINSSPDTTCSVKSSPKVSDFKDDIKIESNVTLDDCVDINWNLPYCVDGVFNKSNISQHSPGLSAINHTDSSLDLNHTSGSHNVSHNFDTPSHNYTPSNNYTPSHNFTTTSHNFTTSHGNDDFMSHIVTNPVSNTFEDFPLPLLDCNLNTSAGSACVNRRDSETVDSGIASPASEKSLGLSRSELYNPLDDVLDQSLLPFFPDAETVPEKGVNQDFSIDLDEIDWELFDCDAKLEPITLSNDEFVKAVMTGDFGLVKRAFMGDGKYSLEQVDLSGKTLLVHAAQHGYDDIADLLIEHGANVNTQISNGFTALMTACQFAELSTVNLLIELGAKVNMQTFNGESALMIAVRRGHKHITWLLLESGANFSLKSNTGHTALNYARAFNHVDAESVISTHAQRLMAEFNRQVSFTLNNLANLREMVFPPQVFNISEEDVFNVNFNYTSQLPPIHGLGYLLFLGHAVFTNEEVTCRFYGPCAVKKACLNSVTLSPLTQEGNFVLAFNPVVSGNNVLTVNVTKEADMKGKLIVCAYKAQLV